MTHGQSQQGVGLRVGSGNGWGRGVGRKIETTVLEQFLKIKKKKKQEKI